jgi:transcriptional regulator with XRE-family HTH domain
MDGSNALLIKLGKRVQELRVAKGFTVLHLAEKSDVAIHRIIGLENAEDITVEELFDIAEALDVEMKDFFACE